LRPRARLFCRPAAGGDKCPAFIMLFKLIKQKIKAIRKLLSVRGGKILIGVVYQRNEAKDRRNFKGEN
jgi:hypothetical protein